jgi:hypothetical protein
MRERERERDEIDERERERERETKEMVRQCGKHLSNVVALFKNVSERPSIICK